MSNKRFDEKFVYEFRAPLAIGCPILSSWMPIHNENHLDKIINTYKNSQSVQVRKMKIMSSFLLDEVS